MGEFLVTGGAGFIGANLCYALLASGARLRILDDLSRPGSQRNLEWLEKRFHGKFTFHRISLGLQANLADVVASVDRIYHLAGQVAVTSSVQDPARDFASNAIGTFQLLEAARRYAPEAIFLLSSTNKVYGSLSGLQIVENRNRFELPEFPAGIPESAPLDFHSPYGCSKGAADQYVRDYARIYGMRTVVMRQSCVYGPRQLGQSDQGWLSWFAARVLERQPIEICGNGKQVRDVLFIDDLIEAYQAAVIHIDKAAGEVFNVGGGPANSISVWRELQPLLRDAIGWTTSVSYSNWRPGDQKIYVSDVKKMGTYLRWSPQVTVLEGVRRLVESLGHKRACSSRSTVYGPMQ